MLYAIIGLGGTFKPGIDFGYNLVHLDGSNSRAPDPNITSQKWIELADGESNASVAAILDDLFSARREVHPYSRRSSSRDTWILVF